MKIDAQVVLAIVGGVMFVLGMLDVIKHRRITPGAKGRLLVALIFALVLGWQAWMAGGGPSSMP